VAVLFYVYRVEFHRVAIMSDAVTWQRRPVRNTSCKGSSRSDGCPVILHYAWLAGAW
jgi:hypothetical protein